MSNFTRETNLLLQQAGWHEARRVGIETAVTELESLGYEVYPKVKHFLAQFYGLQVSLPMANPKYVNHLVFDPLDQAEHYTPYRKPKLARIFQHHGLPFPTIIGWMGPDRYDNLFMDQEGNIYNVNSDIDFVYLIGTSPTKGVENSIKFIKNIAYPHKYLFPRDDDLLYQLFLGHPVIALVGEFKELLSKNHKNHSELAQFFRHQGCRVYSVLGGADPKDLGEESYHPSLMAIPERVDLVVYQSSKAFPNLVFEAYNAGAKVIFASPYLTPSDRENAEGLGMEYMYGDQIDALYTKLIVRKAHLIDI